MDENFIHLVERLVLEHVAMSLLDASFMAFLKTEQVLVLPVNEEVLATVGLHPDLG